jgi:predicted nucleic acid-binding protein
VAGRPQATLSRFLKGCHVEDLSDAQARVTGTLAARCGHDDIVDVFVVEGALRRRHAVVTSNPTDIRLIADAAGVTIEIYSV